MVRLFLILGLVAPLALASTQTSGDIIVSDSGHAVFKDGNTEIIVALVSDLEKTTLIWDQPDSAAVPIATTTTKINIGGMIAPFLTYSIGPELEAPIEFDADLIMPDKTVSPNDHVSNLTLVSVNPRSSLFFREKSRFGFRITSKYPPGDYAARVRIFDAKRTLCTFEMKFAVVK